MSQATKSNVNLKYYIKLAVYLLITFGIGYLPPFGAITPFGMKILGVLLVPFMVGLYLKWFGLASLHCVH